MINPVAVYYAANIYLNAVISFFVSVLFVELFIFAFRLKKQQKFRFIYFLRMIPFIKILYDIFFQYDLSRWAIAYGIDIVNRLPFSLSAYVGAIFYKPFIPAYSYLELSIYNLFTVSFADLITQNAGFTITFIMVSILISGSIVFTAKYLIGIIISRFNLKQNYASFLEIKPDNLSQDTGKAFDKKPGKNITNR